jgi:hypothetical protein
MVQSVPDTGAINEALREVEFWRVTRVMEFLGMPTPAQRFSVNRVQNLRLLPVRIPCQVMLFYLNFRRSIRMPLDPLSAGFADWRNVRSALDKTMQSTWNVQPEQIDCYCANRVMIRTQADWKEFVESGAPVTTVRLSCRLRPL